MTVQFICVAIILAGVFAVKKADTKNYEKIKKSVISRLSQNATADAFLKYFKDL